MQVVLYNGHNGGISTESNIKRSNVKKISFYKSFRCSSQRNMQLRQCSDRSIMREVDMEETSSNYYQPSVTCPEKRSFVSLLMDIPTHQLHLYHLQ